MRISDALLPKFLRLLTDIPQAEIDALLAEGRNPRDAKLSMAADLVRRYHGPEAAAAERERFVRVISEGKAPDEMPEVVLAAPGSPGGGKPLPAGEWSVVEILRACGFAKTNSEARRLIEQGGVSIAEERVADVSASRRVADGDVVKVGSRRYARLRLPRPA
jgi:tyrosyl-tRNA synthetase